MIETERLILRSITEKDAEAIYAYSKRENIGINAGWKPHESIEETHEIIKQVFLNQKFVFGMELKATGKLFGSIGLIPDHKRQNESTRMLGYAISNEHWGHGYTTEAARALIHYGFNEWGLTLISAYCYPYNERSKRVLIKSGFEYEGRLRLAELRYDGEILDHDCFSITSCE